MLFSTLCKIDKNFLNRFGEDSLILIKKSLSFHANSMISFNNSSENVRIVDEKKIRNTNKIFSS